MKRLFFTIFILFNFVSLASNNHDREIIFGSGFDLKRANDVFVGLVKDVPVWADKSCGKYFKGFYKKGDERIEFDVSKKNGKLTGVFVHGELLYIDLNIDRDNQITSIRVKDNEKIIEIKWNYEKIENGHMQGNLITFSIGEKDFEISYSGAACIGSAIYFSLWFAGMAQI